MVLAVAAASLLTLAACTASSRTPGTSPGVPGTSPGVPGTVAAAFPAAGLSFRHPRQWRSYRYQETSSFTDLITFLSTDTLHAPCTVTKNASVTTIFCGPPLSGLSPGGVLITWMTEGMPGRTLALLPGMWTRIGGHRARAVSGAAAGRCAKLGGAWQEQVTIARDSRLPSTSLVSMDACAAAPGVAQARQEITDMLATVRLDA